MHTTCFTWSRKPRNQDGLACGRNVFAVCDGVTPAECDTVTGCQVADYAKSLAGALTESAPAAINAVELREHYARALDAASVATGASTAQATVAMVSWDERNLGVLVAGDSPVAIERSGTIHLVTDPVYTSGFWDLSAPQRSAIMKSFSSPAQFHARQHRLNLAERKLRNTPGGRWIAASGVDSAAAAAKARVEIQPLAGITRVAAMSDGMQAMVQYLAVTDYRGLFDALEDGSLPQLHHKADLVEQADPDRVHHPRESHRDDATIIMGSVKPHQ